jgi:hypothetical protein
MGIELVSKDIMGVGMGWEKPEIPGKKDGARSFADDRSQEVPATRN